MIKNFRNAIKYILLEGTFSSFIPTKNSIANIVEYQNGRNNLKQKIVDPTSPHNLHVSFIFSEEKDVDYEKYEKYIEKRDKNDNIIINKETFNLNYDYYGTAMVLTFKSKVLENEFRKVFNVFGDVIDFKNQKEENLSLASVFGLAPKDYKYSSFKPHISLSYNASKNSHLKKAGLEPPDFDIHLDYEKVESEIKKPDYTVVKETTPTNIAGNVAGYDQPIKPIRRRRKINEEKCIKISVFQKFYNNKYIIESFRSIQIPGSVILINEDTGESKFIRYGTLCV